MQNPALIRFMTEIRHFSRVSYLNNLFAALTITLGMVVIFRQLVPVLLHVTSRTPPQFSPLFVIAGVITLFAGIGWLRAGIRIAEGIRPIREEAVRKGDAIPGEELTFLIVRQLAYFRQNRDAIRAMVIVCILGGVCLLVMGGLLGLDYLSATGNGTVISGDVVLVLPALLILPGIAIASLLSSWYFSKFSRVWDLRIRETDQSETLLQRALGMDKP